MVFVSFCLADTDPGLCSFAEQHAFRLIKNNMGKA